LECIFVFAFLVLPLNTSYDAVLRKEVHVGFFSKKIHKNYNGACGENLKIL